MAEAEKAEKTGAPNKPGEDLWEKYDLHSVVRDAKTGGGAGGSSGIRVSRKRGIKSQRRKPQKLIKGFGKR